MRKPDDAQFFVGIGAQKAGTTWLGEYCKSHPQIFFPEIKEMHYFDLLNEPYLNSLNLKLIRKIVSEAQSLSEGKGGVRRIRRLVMTLESRCFPDAYIRYLTNGMSSERIFGEITPSYATLDVQGLSAIEEMFPGAKYIFLMRNPVDRFWSALRYKFRDKLHTDLVPLVETHLKSPNFEQRGNYERTIENLLKVTDASNCLFLFFENIFFGDGEAEVKKITDFLGIDFMKPCLDKKVNISPKAKLDIELRAIIYREYQGVYSFISNRFNGEIPVNWYEDMKSFS